MRDNQLSVHYTSAEETGGVRPSVGSDHGDVHVPREQVAHVEARPDGKPLADDLPNGVQITVAHFSGAGFASAASAVAVPPSTKFARGRVSRVRTWLLVSAIISVTALFTICSLESVPGFVGQTETHAAVIKDAPRDRTSASAAQSKGSAGNHTALSNAGDSGSGGPMRPPISPQSKFLTRSAIARMPKAGEAKPSRPINGFMVPPPPATPCVLPPEFGFVPMQAARRDAAPTTAHYQSAALPNSPAQSAAGSGPTEASQSAELDVAEQNLEAAMNSSLRTADEWKR